MNEMNSREGSLRNILEDLDIYWWSWDAVGRKLHISDQFISILGYEEGEFDPSIPTLDKNIHPDDAKINLELFRSYLAGERDAYEIEFRLKIDGEWTWYYNRGSIIDRDDDGKPTFVGGISMNISHRYRSMLQKLEESRKFEFIFRNTMEPVLVILMGKGNDSGKIVEVNQAAADFFVCNKEELEGLGLNELLLGDYPERKEEFRRQIIEDRKITVEVKARDFSGKIRYLEINAFMFSPDADDLFISVIRDKTGFYSFQNELKVLDVARKHTEEVFRALIKVAEDRIGLFDSEGNIIIINDAFAETLGYSQEEFLSLEDKERIHPEDQERLLSLRSELFNTGYLYSEYRVFHRDGHILHMSSKAVLLHEPDMKRDYVLFIIRDISRSMEFQQELIDAKKKAEESDMLKSAFLANMSHEIRTPMNSIVGFANLLADFDVDEFSRQEYIKRINRNSEQLLTLISDIIDLAKIESNQLSISFSMVHLENLFNELLNYGNIQIVEKGKEELHITYDPDPENVRLTIESDLVRLTQILQNLLNNAVKFTSTGEITLGYRLVRENVIRFFVKDTGPGIERKHFEIIFDRFRQIDGSDVRRFGGTGLGLAICRNLANLLNGKIWVESELGIGSTFFLELSVKSGYYIDSDGENGKNAGEVPSSLKVLTVDDDLDSLMLITTLLRNEGIQILSCDSGYKALEMLERESLPDVILMDIEMPVLNGIHTMRIIKEVYPEIKVIALSAHALESDKARNISEGFDDYVTKPYSKQSLLQAIRSVVSLL